MKITDFNSLTCTQCGGTITFDSANNNGICDYCGTKIFNFAELRINLGE